MKKSDIRESKVALFDVWRAGRWIGMAEGETPAAARQMLRMTLPNYADEDLIMTPFYGCNTSDQTYEALMGRKSVSEEVFEGSKLRRRKSDEGPSTFFPTQIDLIDPISR